MNPKEAPDIIKKELDDLGSHFSVSGKGDGYHVPDAYFGSLPSRIQDRIATSGSRSTPGFAFDLFRRVVPVAAAVLLVAAVVIGLFFFERNGATSYAEISLTDVDFEYISRYGGMEQALLYDMVLESGMSVEDILYETGSYPLSADSPEVYDEIIESIFDNAAYYGMESRILLSSLD